MSNTPLSEEELRQWVLSLPPSSIRSLEDTLNSIRNNQFKPVEIRNDGEAVAKDKCDTIYDIDHSHSSRTTSPTSSNVSIQSRSKSGKTYENGRRNLKEEDVSTEEASRRSKRRERNRLAAAKCRKRRQDKIDILQKRITELKLQMDELTTSIDQNSTEQDRLNTILTLHNCTLHKSSVSEPRPTDLKLELSQKNPPNNLFICSLSPQLINLSPLFTPATMKLLIDSINKHQSELTPNQQFADEAIDSPVFTTSVCSSSQSIQSANLHNFLSQNNDLLNMNFLSTTSLKITSSLSSTVSTSSIIHRH